MGEVEEAKRAKEDSSGGEELAEKLGENRVEGGVIVAVVAEVVEGEEVSFCTLRIAKDLIIAVRESLL